jgi:hypothetical protein
MLSCGKNSNQIVNTVKSQIDNVDFYCYYNVDEFISQSTLRHLAFDRLVFTSKFISTDKDMGKLCDYIRKELNSVEIVMIVQKGNTSQEEMFKKYFDSPMYTVMYVDSPTTMCLVDSIREPIQVVKARYYTLDKQENSNKKSKMGKFKGGKKEDKNNSKKSGISSSEKEVSSTVEKAGELAENNAKDYSNVNLGKSISNGVSVDTNLSSADFDSVNKSEFEKDVSISNGEKNFSSSNNISTTDEFDLSIGEYGSQHSDSGFVGDDDLSELEAYAQGKKQEQFPEEGTSENKEEYVSVSRVGKPETKDNINIASSSVNVLTKYNIITGVNGSGVTAYVVKTAMAERNKGKRVAIVDLDVKEHGILSFIDVRKFYKSNCLGGIVRNKPYNEDGIDIFSDGYGFRVVDNVLSKLIPTLDFYDVVLFDCPLACLNVISDSFIKECSVFIGCISDISKLIETSSVLEDRDSVSLNKEIYIVEKGIVANKFIRRDDVINLRELMLFPNGCWLK